MTKKTITLEEVREVFNLKVLNGEKFLNKEVNGGYASDLLSNVMAKSKPGDIWITLQSHPNIIAVAVLKRLAGIIIVSDRDPDKETISKAEKEKIPLMRTEIPTFEIIGKLYQMGVHGLR